MIRKRREEAATGLAVAAARRLARAALLASAAALSACGGGGGAQPPATQPPATLTVTADEGGSVAVSVAGAGLVTVAADSSREFTVDVETEATLTAAAADGFTFSGWDEDGTCAQAGPVCEFEAGAFLADAAATAMFAPTTYTLIVSAGSAGAGGSVDVLIGSEAVVRVLAGAPRNFPVNVEIEATLTAVPATGYVLDAWAGVCAGSAELLCPLPAGTLNANRTAGATFSVAVRTLTVEAGPGGSVEVYVDAELSATVTLTQALEVDPDAPPTLLRAVPDADHRLDAWGGACEGAGADCAPPAGIFGADAAVSAAFSPLVAWIGPGAVERADPDPNDPAAVALRAVPHAEGAFVEWRGDPCDGETDLECDAAGFASGTGPLAAVFRPFVAAGIKSLVFGLAYDRPSADDHLRIGFSAAPGSGFVPALGPIAPSGLTASLEVPVHLHPWGSGRYLTEACDAQAACSALPGGEWPLERDDSVGATGYFKAPNAGARDFFGPDVALSADGATLAVGAPFEDSSATGVFAPGDGGYQAALGSGDASRSGAAYVYRRDPATGLWSVEAFVKASNTGPNDRFGVAVALSADGDTLAVGAASEDSSATGVFAPGDEGYQAALDSDGTPFSGGAYVYRRDPASGLWDVEAFVKAPNADAGDVFGFGVALSADGATLAVVALCEDSSATGVFATGDEGYQAALGDNGAGCYRGVGDYSVGDYSGAAYVYRRDPASGRWGVEAFVKAPNAGAGDFFYSTNTVTVALSADGDTLAVGAASEDSSATGVFAPGDEGYQAALDSDGTPFSGAAYVYRRDPASGRWGVEAFVKAPVADRTDQFGADVALSADGATLAVGAWGEDSSATAVFAPGDEGYQAALDSDGTPDSGAAYVYRRDPASGLWDVEAFVKAPSAGAGDLFGLDLALSADGATLAVGSFGEDSSATGAFTDLDADGAQSAMGDNGARGAGAVAVYQRSPDGEWAAASYVKASNTGPNDSFGVAVALSADGATLAVGARTEDGGSAAGAATTGPPASGRRVDDNSQPQAGAVYLY